MVNLKDEIQEVLHMKVRNYVVSHTTHGMAAQRLWYDISLFTYSNLSNHIENELIENENIELFYI